LPEVIAQKLIFLPKKLKQKGFLSFEAVIFEVFWGYFDYVFWVRQKGAKMLEIVDQMRIFMGVETGKSFVLFIKNRYVRQGLHIFF